MEKVLKYAENQFLKTENGAISFGWVVGGKIVSWSSPNAKDLLLGRCGTGTWLYPSKMLTGDELNSDSPLQVSAPCAYVESICEADWNKDGEGDLIVGCHNGFVYALERRGQWPNISFEKTAPLQDKETGVYFNIPFDNPNHPELNNLNGYIDTSFYNSIMPMAYPSTDGKVNLILGDWAGNLWWMEDKSDGSGPAAYTGERYMKQRDETASEWSKLFFSQYGYEYVKPQEKICDPEGTPFLMGDGIDTGIKYDGGVTRPVLYRNEITHSDDLLVLAGMRYPRLYYLQKVSHDNRGKPIFANRGVIELGELFEPYKANYLHAKVIVFEEDGRNNLIISVGAHLAVFRNKRLKEEIPQFIFSHWISGNEVHTFGNNFTRIFIDRISGERLLLDNPIDNRWELRRIQTDANQVWLHSERIPLLHQHGRFALEGETDPNGGADYGFNRVYPWNFDGSGKQHSIVGTDKGLLYLLIEEEPFGIDGEYRLRSVGPLKDTEDRVIRVHNRACACAIDLDGDGLEDLIVGGATYQLGHRTDDNIGAGIYYLLNRGMDESGIPILEKKRRLPIRDLDLPFSTNKHVHLHAVDIDGDGNKEVIVSVGADGHKGRIFHLSEKPLELVYSGQYLEKFSIDENLLDIDDDSELECVFGGGEEGISCYRKLLHE